MGVQSERWDDTTLVIRAEVVPAAQPPDEPRDDRPRRRARVNRADLVVLVASAVSALSVTWLVFGRLGTSAGWGESLAFAYIAFLAIYWLVVRERDGSLAAGDRVMTVVVSSAAIATIIPLVLIIGFVVAKGISSIRAHFFVETQQFVGPLSAATAGGAAHAIVGTIEQVGLAVLISVPLALLCAIFLNEVKGPLGIPVRIFVDAMSGVPTIVAGLFIYAIWVTEFGFSGFAAALAISISMLPVVARTAVEVLRLVPSGLRESSLALGGSEWRTIVKVVIPTAMSGLITAVILGVARAVGETAPLIMTAFGSSLMNTNPFSGPQSALPLFIYKQITESSQASVQARAWAGSLVLIVMVLTLFTLARIVGSGRRPRLRRAAKAG